MRSSRSLLALVIVAACGTDPAVDTHHDQVPPDDCTTSYLTYDNFGEPFVANWCRGCHSSALPDDMRQMAPKEANFDTLDEVRTWSDGIVSKAGGDPATMPPAGGPSDDERTLLAEWITCGAN